MKKEGLALRMKSNYIKIYVFSIILWIIPISIVHFGTKLISTYDGRGDYKTADMLIKDNYYDIDIKSIEKKDGIAQVVSKELKTIVLCGNGIFTDSMISEKEWVNYLLDIASEKKDINDKYYSMAYSEAGDYWLIVSYKNDAFLDITINNTTYKSDNIYGIIWILAILLLAFVSYIIGIFIIIYFYSYRTTRQLVKQVQSLKDYTIMLQDGEYKKRIDMRMDGEILELQEAFNKLAHCLDKEKYEKKQAEDSKKRLLLDISHDLNNPIATIRSSSEILILKEEIEIDLKKKYYEIIHNNSIRANELLKNLFDYVKLDGPDFKLDKEIVDLCEFTRLEMIRYQYEFETAHINFECYIPDKEINIALDKTQMKNVIYNILTNAIKYNKAETTVTIKVEECNNYINFSIKDDGRGIDTNVAKTIFEPFTRADESRNSKTGGSGLGLTIVKKILDSHGFSIELITNIDQGCTFEIRIPTGCDNSKDGNCINKQEDGKPTGDSFI